MEHIRSTCIYLNHAEIRFSIHSMQYHVLKKKFPFFCFKGLNCIKQTAVLVVQLLSSISLFLFVLRDFQQTMWKMIWKQEILLPSFSLVVSYMHVDIVFSSFLFSGGGKLFGEITVN